MGRKRVNISMSHSFVRIACDICCDTDELWYRLYVDDELLIERAAPSDASQCVRVTATLHSIPGRYLLWCRGKTRTRIDVKQVTVLEGTARIESNQYIIIE